MRGGGRGSPGMRYALIPAALLLAPASVGLDVARAEPDAPRTTPIIVIDPDDPARVAACAGAAEERARKKCIYRDADQAGWEIKFYEGLAPDDPDLGTSTDRALRELQPVVDRCDLGAAYYVRYAGGIAGLHLGHPELTPKQVECILLTKGYKGSLRRK